MNNEELIVLNTRIPKSLKNKIKILAIENDVTMQNLIKELLITGMEYYQK